MDIPGFRIERLIAEGGMSSVYLAEQESLGRRVALKILKKFDHPEQADRFLHEARIIASLDHRHIITIHDVGQVGERLYIAMEYLEGGSLNERIERGMPLLAALDLLEAMAACLDYVHQHDIVHRDIKPGNILFHADGTAKLTDFGIAKQLDGDQELTMDGSAFGSPYYISPEQAEGKPLDGRSDIYSLGIVFYQMLTGQKPYAEPSHIETIVAHLGQPIPLLPAPFLGCQELLEQMVAKRPADRIASAQALRTVVNKVRLVEQDRAASRANARKGIDIDHVAEPGQRLFEALRNVAWPMRTGFVLVPVLLMSAFWLPLGEPETPADPLPTRHAQTAAEPSMQQVTRTDRTAYATKARSGSNQTETAAQLKAAMPTAPPAPATRTLGNEASTPQFVETPPVVSAKTPNEPAIAPLDLASENATPDRIEVVLGVSADPVETDDGASDTEQTAPGGLLYVDNAESETGFTTSVQTARVEPTGVEQVDVEIEAHLQAGERALQALRLTKPADDNAYTHYTWVVQRDPDNAAAHAGLDAIAERYATMAARALGRQDYRMSGVYLRRGFAVKQDHPNLLRLRRELAAAQRVPAARRAQTAIPDKPPERSSLRDTEGSGNPFKDFGKVWRSVFD